MKTYSLSDAGYLLFRRRFLQRVGVIAIFLIAALILSLSFQRQINWLFVFPVILLLLAVMGSSLYRSLKQQLEVWRSVRIVIGDDYVARQQLHIPEIRIARGEITALREINNGICVYTADKFRSLVIPVELDRPDYEEIKSVLAAWMPIQPKTGGENARNLTLLMMLLAGFGIIFFSSSIWLVLVAGLAVLGYNVYLFTLLQRDKGVDPKIRRNYVTIIIFLLFILTLKLCLLSGWY